MAVTELIQPYEKRFLQVVIIHEDDEAKNRLIELFKQIPQSQGEMLKGSVRDRLRINRLERTIAKFSPNGQKLSSPDFKKVLPKCLDKKTRRIIGDIYNTHETALVPESILMGLDSLAENRGLARKILNDIELFDRKYIIACPHCARYIAALIYDSRQLAQAAIDSSKGSRCPLCRQPLSVSEGYSVKDVTWQSVAQGLWLEYLVYSIAAERATEAFAGRMAGLHEIDVVAVLGEETILFECRDSAFGHNDPFIIAGKASAIGATKVCGISTQSIHPNVKQAVEEQTRSGRRTFHLEQADEVDEIRSKVTDFLSSIEQTYIERLLPASRRMAYERHYATYLDYRYYSPEEWTEEV